MSSLIRIFMTEIMRLNIEIYLKILKDLDINISFSKKGFNLNLDLLITKIINIFI